MSVIVEGCHYTGGEGGAVPYDPATERDAAERYVDASCEPDLDIEDTIEAMRAQAWTLLVAAMDADRAAVDPIYTVVTFGNPGIPRIDWTRSLDKAIEAAKAARGSGTCTDARVYECESVEQAKSADISRVRPGEVCVY